VCVNGTVKLLYININILVEKLIVMRCDWSCDSHLRCDWWLSVTIEQNRYEYFNRSVNEHHLFRFGKYIVLLYLFLFQKQFDFIHGRKEA